MGHGGTLIAGSSSGNLRLWSVVGVSEMRLPGESARYSSNNFFECVPFVINTLPHFY